MFNWIPKPLKSSLKNIYPPFLIKKYNLKKGIVDDYFYDYKRFIKYSAYNGLKTKENMIAFILKEYHAIEKGLSLISVRPGFGVKRINKLVTVLQDYIPKYGIDSVAQGAIDCLKNYLDFDKKANNAPNSVRKSVEDLVSGFTNAPELGGTKAITKNEIALAVDIDFEKFFKNRFSTREYSKEPVPREVLIEAIEIARYTPSVCNRQGWKVYVVESSQKPLLQKFLGVQNGNRGFGEEIDTLLIVCGKLSSFFARERNQAFVDGGMFAMSLILALHSKGLGTCCLNTSYTAEENEKFNKVYSLDSDIVPIMFIGVGNLKESYNVAISNRKPLSDIAEFLVD